MGSHNRARYLFISPHLDDAILSCSAKISSLIQKKQQVMVINVFNSFGKGPLSLGARRYVQKCGANSPEEFKKIRHKEDQQAMKILGLEPIYLNFIDAKFRINTRANPPTRIISNLGLGNGFLYPTDKNLFSGKLHPEDNRIKKEILQKVKKLLKKNDVVYSCLGVGNHADHLIVREIVLSLKQKKFLWVDLPYAINSSWRQSVLESGIKTAKIDVFVPRKNKRKLLGCYQTQFSCRQMQQVVTAETVLEIT